MRFIFYMLSLLVKHEVYYLHFLLIITYLARSRIKRKEKILDARKFTLPRKHHLTTYLFFFLSFFKVSWKVIVLSLLLWLKVSWSHAQSRSLVLWKVKKILLAYPYKPQSFMVISVNMSLN